MDGPDELKSLSRLKPGDDFKTAVHARLRMPEPRPILWPLPMAAAAGILVGVLGAILFLSPPPPADVPAVVAASPALTETIRDHAYRTRTFVKQADRAPADLVALDFHISGIGPRTATLLAEPPDRLPESERMYISVVAEPIGEVTRLIEEGGTAEAIDRLVELRASARFKQVLAATPTPEAARTYTLAAGPVDSGEWHAFLQARACLYERAYLAAGEGFGGFAWRYPDSALADDAMYWSGQAALEAGDVEGAVTAFIEVMPGGWIDEDQRRHFRLLRENLDLPNVVIQFGPRRHEQRLGHMIQILTDWTVEDDGQTMTIRGKFGPELQRSLQRIHDVAPDSLELGPDQARFHHDLWRHDGEMRGELDRLRAELPWFWMDEDWDDEFEFEHRRGPPRRRREDR